jgi:hypothetical protein
MNKLNYILLLILTCAVFGTAQDSKYLNKLNKSTQPVPARQIFEELEEAITKGNVSAIASFFSSQTYFSLTNGSSGYYSSNQAFYILENFFNLYQVRAFRFNNIQAGESNPYATGVYSYELRGRRDTAQVYVSLKLSGNSWKITQITIN